MNNLISTEELDYKINSFNLMIKEQLEQEYIHGYNEGRAEAFKLVRDYLTKMENQ